ncbi:DUF1707 domain-containing protein [Corynebacterium sp. SCR221107]|uniref:DUF1707 SHOCT-like domain-containing protein n=1 Tax=Corynebacterium sp. SCR221107 TaxID=3017361 RepID=UPI0022EC5F4B|nr:DUF1707 domain-containing protein [Corynebacterium sp. SCR221107]WBT08520.1 DUF1707 domain-containing protein [Corynebacterium sp. SCR221107]
MSEDSSIRIGNKDREQALEMLGRYVSGGHLSIQEFDERSARASAATFRSDLDILFIDLPPLPDTAELARQSALIAKAKKAHRVGTLATTVSTVVFVVAIVLMVTVSYYFWITFVVVPPLVALVRSRCALSAKEQHEYRKLEGRKQ